VAFALFVVHFGIVFQFFFFTGFVPIFFIPVVVPLVIPRFVATWGSAPPLKRGRERSSTRGRSS
jgi:hypothetical protein